ncbi:hypothetical protein GCM10020367_68070 [Streptomyces sannanensis]|uniref:Uncharacterized protein n=1 Tax=Streptomyces sannanensis TaxID=285536 RepID=A0ABP6S4D4_9ACTN
MTVGRRPPVPRESLPVQAAQGFRPASGGAGAVVARSSIRGGIRRVGRRLLRPPGRHRPTRTREDVRGLAHSAGREPVIRGGGLRRGRDVIRTIVRRDIAGSADWIKFAATDGFGRPSDEP